MALRTETGWQTKADNVNRKTSKKKGGPKGNYSKNGKKTAMSKSKRGKGSTSPPAEKYENWWMTMKSQIRFIMTSQGKSNYMLTDAESYYNMDPDQFNEECLKSKKSFIRSMWAKLTPVLMRFAPQIFHIKPPKSKERNVQDWLESMPEPEKCKTDSTVESLWWPTTEEKVNEIIEDASPAKSTYVPRKDRKPQGKVDPLLKTYSNTTQLVPFKDTSRSLVDLRTLETKRRNRIRPKNRFSKNAKNAARVNYCVDA